MKIKNRFYCGVPMANIVSEKYAVPSIAEAVAKARAKLADDPHRDSVNIVQIIRVVRRASPNPPIVVEKVTG